MEERTPRRPRRVTVLRAVVVVAVLGLVGAVSAGWLVYRKLDGNIHTDKAADQALAAQAGVRPKHVGTSENILLMGSDYRPELGSARSDTVILLHLSGDGRDARVVSVPRDLMVPIPSCPKPGGGTSRPEYAQFNWSFEFGGSACTVRTFEQLTDIRVDHYVVLGFTGFAKMIDAVGGIKVDLPTAERDPNVGLDLSAGPHLLDGTDALAYVRAREYVGDGSDTNRMSRQQAFLGLVAAKLRSNGVLLNPARLFPVLDAMTSAITADSGLNSIDKLYGLAERLRAVPGDHVLYGTVPRRPYQPDPDRDVLAQPAAGQLFTALRTDSSDASARLLRAR
jgi:LCP family protein required for cell wall assembly